MALNDLHAPKWPKVLADVTINVAETPFNLATNSFSGRLPVNKVKFKPTLAMQYSFVAGGQYFDVVALEIVTLDRFPVGHPGILFVKAPGGATSMDVEIWN